MSAQVIERLAHHVPIGVRLRDTATGRVVADEIEVRVVPRDGGRALRVVRTRSGVFAAHGAGRLLGWEIRDADEHGDIGPAPAVSLPARVEVRDLAARFHSFAIAGVQLPEDGILMPACGSPPASPPDDAGRSIPLFSLPQRPAPAGMAVVRARLMYEAGTTPAAHAALEIVPAPGLPPVRGIADERGEVVVIFGFPQPAGIAGSPPAGTRRPLTGSSWTVTVRALVPAIASPPDTGGLPDLCTFLDQIPATLETASPSPTPLGEATLHYGRELVLRTSDLDPELIVRP